MSGQTAGTGGRIAGFILLAAAVATILLFLGMGPLQFGSGTDKSTAGPPTDTAESTDPPPPPPDPPHPDPPQPEPPPTTEPPAEEVLYVIADLEAPYTLGKDRGIACADSIVGFCMVYDMTVENEAGYTPNGCYLSWKFFQVGNPEPADSGRSLYCEDSLFVGRDGSTLPPGNYELELRVELDDGSVTEKRQPILLEL